MQANTTQVRHIKSAWISSSLESCVLPRLCPRQLTSRTWIILLQDLEYVHGNKNHGGLPYNPAKPNLRGEWTWLYKALFSEATHHHLEDKPLFAPSLSTEKSHTMIPYKQQPRGLHNTFYTFSTVVRRALLPIYIYTQHPELLHWWHHITT